MFHLLHDYLLLNGNFGLSYVWFKSQLTNHIKPPHRQIKFKNRHLHNSRKPNCKIRTHGDTNRRHSRRTISIFLQHEKIQPLDSNITGNKHSNCRPISPVLRILDVTGRSFFKCHSVDYTPVFVLLEDFRELPEIWIWVGGYWIDCGDWGCGGGCWDLHGGGRYSEGDVILIGGGYYSILLEKFLCGMSSNSLWAITIVFQVK